LDLDLDLDWVGFEDEVADSPDFELFDEVVAGVLAREVVLGVPSRESVASAVELRATRAQRSGAERSCQH